MVRQPKIIDWRVRVLQSIFFHIQKQNKYLLEKTRPRDVFAMIKNMPKLNVPWHFAEKTRGKWTKCMTAYFKKAPVPEIAKKSDP